MTSAVQEDLFEAGARGRLVPRSEDLCHDHQEPKVGVLRSTRGGARRVCRRAGCGEYFAVAWAPAMPRLWCERIGGPWGHLGERCPGCCAQPGYDYLQGVDAVFVELVAP